MLLEDGDALLFADRLLIHRLNQSKEFLMGNIRLEYGEVSEGNTDDDCIQVAKVRLQSWGPVTLYSQTHFL